MKNTPAYIIGEEFVTIKFKGEKAVTVGISHPNFDLVIEAVKEEAWDKVKKLSSVVGAIVEWAGNNIEVIEGVIYSNGTPLNTYLAGKIIKMMEKGFNVTPLLNFQDNLMENPSKRAVDDLYSFLEYGNLPITEDGYFVAYRVVTSEYKDHHTNSVDNAIGAIPTMPRNAVDENPNSTCSHGFHICSLEYAKGFFGNTTSRMTAVKVNPKDVVAIPRDYNNTKARVCSYEVIEDLGNKASFEELPEDFYGDIKKKDTPSKKKKSKKSLTQVKKKYRGVTQDKGSWKAQVQVGGVKKHIGSYLTSKDAALAWDNYIIANGLKKKLNFK